MTIQYTANTRSIIAKETVEGTAETTVDKRLQSTSLLISPNAEVNTFRANGSEFITVAQRGKEWTKIAVDGILNFHDICYLLSGCVKGGITPAADGTNGKLWAFAPNDTIDTFTIDFGDSVEAEEAAGCHFPSLAIDINRSESTVSGEGVGKLLSYGVTLDSASLVSQKIVDPSKWQVMFADTYAGLAGASEGCNVYEAHFETGTRWGQHWPLCSTATSYSGRVKMTSDPQLTFSITNESAGRALVTTNLRGNVGKYVMLKNTGDVISGAMASAYKIEIKTFGFFTAGPEPKDFEGLQVLPFTMALASVSDLTTAFEINVINTLAAL